MTEVGYVKQVRNFLLYLDGLPTSKINDLVIGENGGLGYVSGLHQNEVEVLLLDGAAAPGESFRPVGTELSVPVGDFLLGRTMTPLGKPLDGKSVFPKNASLSPLEKFAPGVSQREFIKKQFDTGISLVDTIIPLGKGQRELIIGDARSGKTGFVIDVVANQKNTGVICVYGCLGKPTSEIRNLVRIFEDNGAMNHTVVISSFSADAAPLIFLTPQAAMTVAEYFQNQGKDVLLILDDLGSHAKIYREISLLSERPPGREAYPGDIFYQHAHLLERAGSFNAKNGGGSITALPLIELDLSDFTSFIPTNLMSMTDGHLLFRSGIYSQGRRPAADIFLSVSRVGQQTQNQIQNQLAFRIKQMLSQAEQLTTLASFSTELALSTQIILRQKGMVEEILKQAPLVYLSNETQCLLLTLPFTKWGQQKDDAFFAAAKTKLLAALSNNPILSDLTKNIFKSNNLDELIAKIDAVEAELVKVTKDIAEPGKNTAGSDLVDPETWMPPF